MCLKYIVLYILFLLSFFIMACTLYASLYNIKIKRNKLLLVARQDSSIDLCKSQEELKLTTK